MIPSAPSPAERRMLGDAVRVARTFTSVTLSQLPSASAKDSKVV